MCAQRQAEILDAGCELVCPGGRLVYSTCTFAPEENEQTIEAFLKRHPDFYPESLPAPWFTSAGEGMYRLWPHKLRGEGHFAAVLRRRGDEAPPEVKGKKEPLPKEWEAFAKELNITLPAGKAVMFGQNLFWAPEELPDIRRLKVLRPGLELGEVKKGRFEPAHALALWLNACKNERSLDPEGEALRQYMHGNVLRGREKGWTLIKAGNFSIGWAKGDGSQLKNHYPKGLRR
jgi:NOL1/NOP2/fmu family ribosome biogenesis protein